MAAIWHKMDKVPAIKNVIYVIDKEFGMQRVYVMSLLCFELVAAPHRGNRLWAYEQDIVNDACSQSNEGHP